MSLRRGITLALLTLGLGIILQATASAQFGGLYGPISGGGFGPIGNQDHFQVSEEVHSFYSGHSIVPVKQLLNLSQYSSFTLSKIILVAQSRNGGASAELLINGSSASFSERLGTALQNIEFTPRTSRLSLGRDIQSLQVRLQGQVYIQRVIAVLEDQNIRPGQPGGAGLVAHRYISQTFRGFETIALRNLMNLDRDHQAMAIREVVVRAEASYGSAQMRLKVNGSPTGTVANVSRGRQEFIFALGHGARTLGHEVQRLELDLAGDIYVEQIEVHFERPNTRPGPIPRPHPGPTPNDQLTRFISRPLAGAHALNLIDLMNASALDGRREVSHIEVSVSGANQRAGLALCVNTARGQVCDTQEDLSYARQVQVRLDVRGRSVLRDLLLTTKGTLRLEQITLYFY